MEKRIEGMMNAEFVSVPFMSQEGINKVASCLDTHIPPTLAKKIQEIEANPEPGVAYLYNRALGAGEVYGPNNNGDWFGRNELINRHHTFVTDAYLFRHHQNKDPRNKIGDIIASAYNYPLDVVDLILKAPVNAISKDLDRHSSGMLISTSMGAKVPYDECSYCGHKAKRRILYCDHLKRHMLKWLNGELVYARNPRPTFMDMSIVLIPAAQESAMLRKIASYQQKISAMKKKDVGNLEERDVIHPGVIEAASELDTDDAIATLHDTYGILRPDEFQAVMQKDASYLCPDIIPFVSFERVDRNGSEMGESIGKLAHAFSKVAGIKTGKKRKVFNFLSSHEKRAYLRYRASLDGFSKEFIR